MSAFLVRGDARRLPLATGSVQCVVTSPPYFGLRSYGGQTSVWGGNEDCEHEWLAAGTTKRGNLNEGFNHRWNPNWSEGGAQVAARPLSIQHGATCTRCGAWRGELGSEPDVGMFVAHLVEVFRECRRVMRDDAVLFCNIGDSFSGSGKGPGNQVNGKETQSVRQGFVGSNAGSKPIGGVPAKSLLLVPERLAIALSDDGWIVRSRIAWCKAAPMPESVRDRPTSAWEHIWMLTKGPRYHWDQDAVRETYSELNWTKEADQAGTSLRGKIGLRSTPKGAAYADGIADGHARGDKCMLNAGYTHAGRNLWNYWVLSPDPYSISVPISRVRPVGADAAGDDIRRTTSPDCPLHAGLPDLESTAQRGGRVDASAESLRSPDTRTGLAQAPLFEPAPTDPHHAPDSAAENSDSSHQKCSPVATDHSNGTHRTAPDLGTTQPCTPSVQSPADTERIEGLHGSSDSADHSDVSSSEPGDLDDRLSAQIPPDNAGISSQDGPCTCEYYQHYTEKSSHFATFPREIPRRCILAATSDYGACKGCGAPWRRVVERNGYDPEALTLTPKGAERERLGFHGKGSGLHETGWQKQLSPASITTGWVASCKCGPAAGVRPCVVLDIFSGSGTTAYQAARMGRIGVGVELSESYIKQAQSGRLAQQFLPLSAAPPPEAPRLPGVEG